MQINYPDQGQLLKLFIISLNTTYQQAIEQQGNIEEYGEVRKEIETILTTTNSWREAYKAEQLMISLLSGIGLHNALSRKLIKTKRLGEEITQYYSKQYEDAESDECKKALLMQLTQDLQWHDELMRIKQNYIHRAWEIVSCAFCISFILFFFPSIIPWFKEWLDIIETGEGRGLDIFTAIMAGALGASFSMLIGLRTRLEGSSLYTLKAMQKKNYVFFRVMTGMGAGLILFYFLQSGLLTGSIFPDWENTKGWSDRLQEEFSLLIIWCFLSGFSEKLLPNILSKTEEQASVRTLER